MSFAIAFLLGLLLSLLIVIPSSILLVAIFFCSAAVLSFSRHQRIQRVLCVALFLLFGLWRGASIASNPQRTLNDRQSFTGIVIETPRIGLSSQRFTVRRDDGVSVLIHARPNPAYAYGDRIRLRCTTVDAGTCFFPTIRRIGRRQGNVLLAGIFGFRATAHAFVTRALPEPHASVGLGLLIGDDAGFSKELRSAFVRTGTTHLFAVSGANMLFFGGIFWGACGYLGIGRRRRTIVTVAMLLLYTALVGAPASAVRGFLFAVFFYLAPIVGRPRDLSSVVLLTAAFLLALHPSALFDLGFQLSFLSVSAIVFGVPIFGNFVDQCGIQDRFHRMRAWCPSDIRRTLFYGIGASCAATIATLPLLAATFGTVSLVTIPANLLLLPLVVLATPALVIMLLASFVHPFLGVLFAFAPYLLLSLMLGVVAFFAAVPSALVAVRFVSVPMLFFTYGLLIFLTAVLWARLPTVRRAVFLDDGP